MNITQNIRKNNKHYKSIIVFKELYRDYFKHNNTTITKASQTDFYDQTNKSNNLNFTNTNNFSKENQKLSTNSFTININSQKLNNFSKKQPNLNNTIEQNLNNTKKLFNTNGNKNNQTTNMNKSLIKSKSTNQLSNSQIKPINKTYHIKDKQQDQLIKDIQPKVKKVHSTEKFTQYLINQKKTQGADKENQIDKFVRTQREQRNGSKLFNQTLMSRSKSIKIRKSMEQIKNSTFLFKLLQRTQLQQLQKQNRSYYKNTYTQSHPFFEKNPNIFKVKNPNQHEIPQILPEIFKENLNQKTKNPVQRRIQLSQLKSKLSQRKVKAVEKFSNVRYNYLLKKHLQNRTKSLLQQDQLSLTTFKKVKIVPFGQTKQNIFPGSTLPIF